jgi:hypothetical protein
MNNEYSLTCPFAIRFIDVQWNDVEKVIDVCYKDKTVVVSMKNENVFLVEVDKTLFTAIFNAGEKRITELS